MARKMCDAAFLLGLVLQNRLQDSFFDVAPAANLVKTQQMSEYFLHIYSFFHITICRYSSLLL